MISDTKKDDRIFRTKSSHSKHLQSAADILKIFLSDILGNMSLDILLQYFGKHILDIYWRYFGKHIIGYFVEIFREIYYCIFCCDISGNALIDIWWRYLKEHIICAFMLLLI